MENVNFLFIKLDSKKCFKNESQETRSLLDTFRLVLDSYARKKWTRPITNPNYSAPAERGAQQVPPPPSSHFQPPAKRGMKKKREGGRETHKSETGRGREIKGQRGGGGGPELIPPFFLFLSLCVYPLLSLRPKKEPRHEKEEEAVLIYK